MSEEYLLLKWGGVKGYNVGDNETFRAALQRWADEGVSMSAMAQHDTETQKQAICDAIDACNGEITNDWTGEKMTKAEAKAYVLDYGKK